MTARNRIWLVAALLTAIGLYYLYANRAGNAAGVVVYSALDQDFSEPIFTAFGQREGIEVAAKFDTESTKTVGLAQAIMAERQRPHCDLFWNNEILHTLRLEKQGLLDEYRSPLAKNYDPRWSSPSGHWQAFAARARVLLVNRNAVRQQDGAEKTPSSIFDLTDSQWRGRIGIAKPLFGTTATHAACLFATLGTQRAKQFFARLKANQVEVLSGNKQVATAVGSGQLAFGLTDTDDAMEEIAAGSPVEIIFPDQAADGLGTLLIPNTLAVIRGCPHPAAARKLIDYLLTSEVESTLAAGPSAQIPLNRQSTAKPRIPGWRDNLHWMDTDFAAAADSWDEVAKYLRDEFTK